MWIFLHVRSSGNVTNLIASIIQSIFSLTAIYLTGKNTQKHKLKKKKHICMIGKVIVFLHSLTTQKKLCLLLKESPKLRAMRAHVPTYFAYLCAHVPTCLACSHAHVPVFLACLSAHVTTCLACSRANVPCVLTYSYANVPYMLTCYNFE